MTNGSTASIGSSNAGQIFLYFTPLTFLVYLALPHAYLLDIATSYMLKNQLYFRFTLSLRDVEEMLAERGIETNYETIRCWALKFGRLFAQNLRRSRPKPTGRWHLDEM